ncbi:MAG: hypothetical protein ACW99A_18895 [Candidatus Kariarchaeaceae archaeon]|jgi:hypothetical protein
MTIRVSSWGISLFLVLTLVAQPLSAQDFTGPDITKIGISKGDTFTYQLLSYIYEDNVGFWDENDTEDNPADIRPDEEFTITILNATPKLNESGDYVIETETNNGSTTIQSEDKIGFGETFTFTDWDYWEKLIREDPGSVFLGVPDPYSIENGDKFFIIKYQLDGSEDGLIVRLIGELHYDKATGALLYLAVVYDIITTKGDVVFLAELIIAQKGHTNFERPKRLEIPPEEEGFPFADVPGFEFFYTITAFIAILAIIRTKKQN